MFNIDVVIPARNEQETVRAVINAFRDSWSIGQIIVVVNDSTDKTEELAREVPGTRVLYLDGRGKGQAVSAGLALVTTPRVIFCDADLHGLTNLHVSQLCAESDGVVIGVPDFTANVPWPVHKEVWGWVSGIRCLPTRVAKSVPLYGYTMEVMLNHAAQRAGLPSLFTRLYGVTGTPRWNADRMEQLVEGKKWLDKLTGWV